MPPCRLAALLQGVRTLVLTNASGEVLEREQVEGRRHNEQWLHFPDVPRFSVTNKSGDPRAAMAPVLAAARLGSFKWMLYSDVRPAAAAAAAAAPAAVRLHGWAPAVLRASCWLLRCQPVPPRLPMPLMRTHEWLPSLCMICCKMMSRSCGRACCGCLRGSAQRTLTCCQARTCQPPAPPCLGLGRAKLVLLLCCQRWGAGSLLRASAALLWLR